MDAGAISLFLIAHRFDNVKATMRCYGLSQFLGILSALVFVVAADAYRTGRGSARHYVLVLLPVADLVHARAGSLGRERCSRRGTC